MVYISFCVSIAKRNTLVSYSNMDFHDRCEFVVREAKIQALRLFIWKVPQEIDATGAYTSVESQQMLGAPRVFQMLGAPRAFQMLGAPRAFQCMDWRQVWRLREIRRDQPAMSSDFINCDDPCRLLCHPHGSTYLAWLWYCCSEECGDLQLLG